MALTQTSEPLKILVMLCYVKATKLKKMKVMKECAAHQLTPHVTTQVVMIASCLDFLCRCDVLRSRCHPLLRNQYRDASGRIDAEAQSHGLRIEGIPTKLRANRRGEEVEGEAEGTNGPAAEESHAHATRIQSGGKHCPCGQHR